MQKKIIKLAVACSIAFILPAANADAQVGQIKTEQRNMKNDQSVLDRKISVNIQNGTLQNALNQIAGKAGISFSYDARSIVSYTQINLSASNQKLSEILEELLKPYRLSFTLAGKSIIIIRKIVATVSVSGKGTTILPISGRVIDESGKPVPGASVLSKGSRSTATNNKGEFQLMAAEGTVLKITHLGFAPAELKINSSEGGQVRTIVLSASTSKLDEVVIIPYGTTSRRFLTGDITKVTAEDIEKQPVTNLLQAMQGRVPGMIITQQSGVPGSNFTVQIRGQNSILNGNTPLYIIDGIPYSADALSQLTSGFNGNQSGAAGSAAGVGGLSPLNSINPADLESIEVLKDADATAIYGSRGANGVILITTKKGKAGPMRISANLNSGMSKTARIADYMDTQQYLAMRTEAFKNDGLKPGTNDADLNGTWDQNRYTNWAKELIGHPSYLTNAQVSVSGGAPQTQYLIGMDYSLQNPPYEGSFSDKRGSVHFNINNTSLDNKFRMILSATYGLEGNNLPGLDLTSYINMPPNAPAFRNPDGSLNWITNFTNPYASLLQPYNANTQNLVSNLLLSYEITKDLQVKTSFGYTDTEVNETRQNPLSSFQPNTNTATQSNSSFGYNKTSTYIFEPQAEYKHHIFNGNLSVLAGGTFQGNTADGQIITATGFSSDAFLNNVNAAKTTVITNTYGKYKYMAGFTRISYNLENKYLLNITGRRDGSSRFGPDKQFANFGAVGAGWIFSEENLVKKYIPFLSFGKIRGSYGLTGSDQIGNYRYLNTYTSTSSYSYQGVSGLYATRLFNPGYSWESNKKLEAGLELGFLKDRISVTTNWYRNRSSDQLVNIQLAPTTGNANVQSNLPATVQNSGWEWQLNTVNIKRKDFNWRSSFNISASRNKLLAFPGLAGSSYASTYVVGKPVTIVKLYQAAGVNPATGVYQFVSSTGALTSTPNYLTDQTVIKDINPKFFGGFQNTLDYKGFQLDVFLQFVKQDGRNLLTGLKGMPGSFNNLPVIFLDAWHQPGDQSQIEKYTQSFGSQAGMVYSQFASSSTAAYTDASFIRCKNVALSYRIAPGFMEHLHINSAKVYLQAQNLFTITKYLGADPESQGLVLPPLQTITAGIQFTL